MYFKTLVTDWRGIGRCSRIVPHTAGQEYVFNIKNVTNLKQLGSGSEFLYATKPYDRKTGYERIQCNTNALVIKQEYDIFPTTNILELEIFANNNVNGVKSTLYISVNDFSYAWSHNPYPQYSWLRYCLKSGKDKIVLVDMTLVDIVGLDDQFDENNVQWYYYVDPSEEIFPNKYIRVT